MFTFSGEASYYEKTKITYVGVYLNNVRQMHLVDNDDRGPVANLSFTWTMNLEQGDVVYLKIDGGQLYADSDEQIFFNGFLLKASD